MPAGQSKALALLQKVNSQLKGERVPLKTKEEDELAVYLNSLTQKSQLPKAVNFEDFGEISISSGTDPRNSATPRGRRSASPASPGHKPSNKFIKKKLPSNNEIKKQQSKVKQNAEIKNSTSTTKKTSDKSSLKLQQQISLKSESESDGLPKSLIKNNTKFIKTKTSDDDRRNFRSPSPQLRSRSSSVERKHNKSKKNEIIRTLGNVYLSSDEESLAEFIHNLSLSDSSKRQPKNLVAKKHQKWHKKAVSPVAVERTSPFKRTQSHSSKLSRSLSQDSDLMDSIDSEILENTKGRNTPMSIDEPVQVNLKDISSLASTSSSPSPRSKKSPARNVTSSSPSVFKASSSLFKAEDKKDKKVPLKGSKLSPKKSSSKSSLFENLGIHMVDELIDANQAAQPLKFDVDISEESEIKTEKSEDRKNTFLKQKSAPETFSEKGGAFKKSAQRPQSATSDNISETSKKNWKRRKAIDTDQDYSDSFLSDSQSKSYIHSKTTSHTSPRRSKIKKSKSQDKNIKKHKIILEGQEVDISTVDQRGTTHHWNTKQSGFLISGPYGLQYVDPKPVATHVVSADSLEALTAYSPNMLALQEMMKTQLELVRNFVAIQDRIYQSCMDGLNYNYKYTTLEDTKEYIRQHKKKPLTFEEALQLVEQEEKGISLKCAMHK
ncbi:hypothetical protein Btru_040406 [Bulinus truncatus]|nr:hypothetical protein Btru_040406 [Bulinus truncatus]